MASRYSMEYGKRIQLARRAVGLSRARLGEALGVGVSTVDDIEAGRRASSAEEVVGCAEVLKVPPGWLLVGDYGWMPTPASLTRVEMRRIAEQLTESARILSDAAAPPPSTGPAPVEHPNAKIHPPWDDDTVTTLNAFQAAGVWHPYTCPEDHYPAGEARLVATARGWVCSHAPGCGYTQSWAHASMAATPGATSEQRSDDA